MKQILLLMLGLAAAVEAQTTNAPRTYFDAFNATPDVLLVRGMSLIGTLDKQISYPVEIRVERLVNGQTTNAVYAVAVRTKVGQTTLVDYIDYDELDAVIRSVPLISQADTSVAPMDRFETSFHTRSGLTISKIGKLEKSVITLTSGDIRDTNSTRNQLAPFVLNDFGTYLTTAKTKIDAIVASGQ
ncbi:MAG: hypothetical protein ACLQU4_16985 [Limisphaerales bacterium]